MALKIALVALFGLCAFLIAAFGDPYPNYGRPRSLFFAAHRLPTPPVVVVAKTPEPEPEREFTAVLDLGETKVESPFLALEGAELVSQNLETVEAPPQERETERRKPIAMGIIGDCSALVGGAMPNFIQPAKMMAPFASDALFSFMTVANGAQTLMPWTRKSEAEGKAPTDYTASGGYVPDTSIQPILDLFDDPACKDRERIAVMLGDLVGNREDEHIRMCVKQLAARGLKVFVVKYGDAPLNPEVPTTCESTGGKVILTDDLESLGEGIAEIQKTLTPSAPPTYRLIARFRSRQSHRVGESVEVEVDGEVRSFRVTQN